MVGSFIQFVRNLESVGFRKKGRKPVFNANQFYPFALERELQQATVAEFLRALEENISLALNGESFGDTLEELMNDTKGLPKEFVRKVEKVSAAICSKVTEDFARQSEMTIGQPYFPPATKPDIMKTWEQNFQNLCISAESDAKKEISRIVAEGKMKGWNKRQVEAAVREKLPAETKHRAELIARTESAKLNSAARLETYKEVGIKYYVWMTTIDGRERDNHKNMNNRICSVSDPTVWYEETEDGLVEKKRDPSTMFIGNPGEDFQCRCSMVSWDPEIDGKFEVKGPTPEELAEMERQERERKEREKQERLAKEAAEREAREKAERELAEQRRKVEILQKANERHAARTDQEAQAIQNELDRRVAIRADVRKAVAEVKGIPDVDITSAENSLQRGGKKAYAVMESEANKLHQIYAEINGLSRLDNPMEVAKQWGYAEAKNVNSNVERTLGRWSGSSLAEQKQALEHEIRWVEDNKKYKTWKVAQDAYKKELAIVEFKIKWEKPDQEYTRISGMLGPSKSKAAAEALAELQAARAADDLPRFEKALKKAEAVYNKLHAKKLSKKASASTGSGDHVEYEGTDLSWSRLYVNDNLDRKDFSKRLLIENVLQDQGFMNLPKLVDMTEFKELLKNDHYLATRTYGTYDDNLAHKLTVEARDGLYHGEFYVKCQGYNAHGFGMYFGCDPKLGKNAQINVDIWHQYERGKTYCYEEFCTLSKSAKIIDEDKIESEYLKRGLASAPTDRIKKSINKAITNGGSYALYDFKMDIMGYNDLTLDELNFIKKGLSVWKELPDKELMKDPSKLPIHKDFSDHGILAAKMGYDAIWDAPDNYGVMLNRSKMILLNRQKDLRTTKEIFKQEFGV